MEFSHFLSAMTPFNIALALFGVVAGTVIGSIPGLTATMALAVLVPITFSMDPASALILLGAIYTGAIYGGAYAAILLNTPGTPSAIATTFDGYPMAKRGDGDLAVALACFSSVFGGMVGAIALLLLAPPLSKVALAFGPVEYFWLSIFGLSLIASLSNGNLMKGLAGGAFGMILSTVGVAEISADIRLTFGSQVMIGGFGVAGLLIGRYAYKSIVTIPKAVLVPTVGFMTIIGTFAIRNSVSDVIIMLCLGVFGWLIARFGFAASPIVLGLILGPIAEQGFVQGWTIGAATNNLIGMFFGRPISQAIIAFTLMTLILPIYLAYKKQPHKEV